MNTPASKSQKRAMALLGIAIEKDSYVYASEALEAAGCRPDALANGGWRVTAKLNDEQFIAGIRVSFSDDTPFVERGE